MITKEINSVNIRDSLTNNASGDLLIKGNNLCLINCVSKKPSITNAVTK